jgi:predicted RND superfamily exporter protein
LPVSTLTEKKGTLKKKISIDQGLVGQAFQEGSYIYMTDVPKDYVKITSGLGEATPRSIFIIPLKTRTHTVGVLELAFFHKLKPHQIQFLVEISENLANSIFQIQSADNNLKLLEQTQSATNQLKTKEVELTTHLKELTLIQTNLNIKNIELEEAKIEIENKKNELEKVKEAEYELIESKLKTQQIIHELTIEKLKRKIFYLEEKIKTPVLERFLN